MRLRLLLVSLILMAALTAVGQTVPPKCPVVSIAGPAGITYVGDIMVLRAQISGLESGIRPTYDWKVSGELIIDRIVTDDLRIQTSDKDAHNFISATVSVRGLPEGCPNTASGSWGVTYKSYDPIIDQYGRVPWREEQARLDNFHLQIVRNPGSTGLIYMQIKRSDSLGAAKKHARKIAKHFRSRDKHFDLPRLMIAIYQGAEFGTTSFSILAKGSKVPLCGNNCILLSGKDL